jgi:Domain of unknown function (DUF1929)
MSQPSLNNQQHPHLSASGGFPKGMLSMVVLSIGILTGCANGPSSDAASQSPSGFSATPSAGAIALRWNAMGGNAANNAANNATHKYAIERRSSTGGFVPLLSTKQTTLVDADVQGNRAYVYRLVASSAPAKPLESNLVFTPPEAAPGEVLFKPAVLNPVLAGQVARLEALTFGSQAVTWSVSPNTGSLVVEGRQVSFSSSVPGTYSLTATNTQATGTQARSAQIQLRVLSPAQASVLALVGPAFTYVNANADLRLSIGGKEFGENVTWKVTPSGPAVVRNDNAYVFVANQPGTYAIQAVGGTSNQSSETLNLEVRRSEVTGLQLRINPISLELGDVATLEPTFTGNGDFDRSLNWQINPSGANASNPTGNPTRNPPPRNSTYRFVARTAGTYSITAVSASNPNQTANVTLQVTAPTQTVTPSGPGAWGAKIDWPERSLDDKDRIVAIHAAVMPDGKVMTFGWSPSDGRAKRNDGAIWDPVSGAFQTLRNPTSNIFCAGTSLLIDGRLFVAGGLEQAGTEKGIADLNIFDAAQFEKNAVLNRNNGVPQEFSSAGWTKLTNMNEARYYPSALTLGNGEVFISGGTKSDESINRSSDLWKPNGQVVNLPNADRDGKRFYPMLFQGSDGSIFEVGPREGIYAFGTNDQGSARELLDRDSLFRDYGSAVMYRPGRIVVIGGGGAEDNSSGPTASAKTINITDPNDLVVAETGSMSLPRRQHTAVLLANGQVLVVGGSSGAGFNNGAKGVLSSEVWDPISGTFKTLASMTTKRMYHSIAILLPDARMLAAGGGRGTPDAPDEASGEVFSPPYLFNNDGTPAIRPVISSVPTSVTYGTGFTIGTDSPNLARATMVRLSSVTHSTNFDQRFIELPILSRDGNNLNVNVNSDRFVTQPGFYMVYVLNAQGVPSVSKIIQLQ